MPSVTNVHSRSLRAPAAEIGALIDSLASDEDRLWPHQTWPPMRLDGPLAVGARGGHGPVRYIVTEYVLGQRVRFDFQSPRGFRGFHAFELDAGTLDQESQLRHRLEMRTSGAALLSWPLLFRPLHDALIEDALDRAAVALGQPARRRPYSIWVRFLRALLKRPARR